MPFLFWLNTVMLNEQLIQEPAVADAPKRMPLAEAAQIKHIHSDGVYIKAFRVPAGLQIYTKRFPNDHVTILGQGSVLIEQGDKKLKVVAPAHYVFEAMTRCKIITLEDSVWYCIHATTETDQAVLDELY
jgi:hypothetical protein